MRIAIDPADLRSTSTRLRAEADRFESLASQVGGLGLPEMPPAERAQVSAKLRAAATSLRGAGLDADAMATALDRRAALALIAALGGGLSDWSVSLFGGKGGGKGGRGGLLNLLLRLMKSGSKGDFFTSGPFRDGKSLLKPNMGKLFYKGKMSPRDRFLSQEGRWAKKYGDYKDWPEDEQKVFGGVGMSKAFKLLDKKVWGKSGDNYDLALLAAEAEAKGGLKYLDGNVEASAEASLAAYLARVSVGFKSKHVQAQAGASVGANAKAGVGAKFGKDGVTAKAGAEAFAGGEGHLSGGLGAAGVTTKAQAGVSYGIGGKANAEADLGLKKVKLKAELGATLGLGVNVGVDIEVKPMETAKSVAHGAESVAHGAKDIASKIPHPW
jgi:hypothetical protein